MSSVLKATIEKKTFVTTDSKKINNINNTKHVFIVSYVLRPTEMVCQFLVHPVDRL